MFTYSVAGSCELNGQEKWVYYACTWELYRKKVKTQRGKRAINCEEVTRQRESVWASRGGKLWINI